MVKKIALGTLAVAAVGTFVFGRDAFSYLSTGADNVRTAVRSGVPVEFEIERARKEVENLTPEIRKSLHIIAEQEVEVQNLKAAITRQEGKLGEQEESIHTLSSDLKSGRDTFKYASRSFDRNAVQKDLADRFNRFKLANPSAGRCLGLRGLQVLRSSACVFPRPAPPPWWPRSTTGAHGRCAQCLHCSHGTPSPPPPH